MLQAGNFSGRSQYRVIVEVSSWALKEEGVDSNEGLPVRDPNMPGEFKRFVDVYAPTGYSSMVVLTNGLAKNSEYAGSVVQGAYVRWFCKPSFDGQTSPEFVVREQELEYKHMNFETQ